MHMSNLNHPLFLVGTLSWASVDMQSVDATIDVAYHDTIHIHMPYSSFPSLTTLAADMLGHFTASVHTKP